MLSCCEPHCLFTRVVKCNISIIAVASLPAVTDYLWQLLMQCYEFYFYRKG